MQPLVQGQAVAILLGACVVGVVVHELSHILALRLAGVSHTVEVLPTRDDRKQFSAGIGNPLARVSPTRIPDDVSPWAIRCAALMPLLLALPLVLISLGVFPDPFASGNLGAKMVVVGWLGCSIPSPQDFSIAWYPERAIAAERDRQEGSPATQPADET